MPASAVTFTAVWAEASGEIGGSVVWDDESDPQPAGQVLITLTRGNQTLDEVLTDADGSFAFRQLPPGAYNLVASYGEITQTEKILLTGSETAQCTIRLPRGKTNSVLEVLDGAPDVVVGNLDRLFDQQPDQVYTEADRTLVESGGKVEICHNRTGFQSGTGQRPGRGGTERRQLPGGAHPGAHPGEIPV